MKKNLFIISLLLTVALLCTACLGTSRAVSQIKELVEKGDVDAAMEIYTEKIHGDGDAMTEVNTMLRDLATEALEKFKSGDWDYATATYRIESIYAFSYDDAAKAMYRIEEIQASREILSEAKSAMDSSDFEIAIDLLDEIESDSTEYEEAQTLLDDSVTGYRDSITQKVDDFLQQNQFDNAEAMIEQGARVLGDDEALEAMVKKVDDARRAWLMAEATALSNTDLPGAIGKLTAALEQYPDDPDFMNTLLTYNTQYTDQMLAEADKIAKTGDYDGAIGILTSAQAVCSDEKLQTMIDTYKSYKPQYIADLEYFMANDNSWGNGFSRPTKNVTDNLGNPHVKPIGLGDSYGYNGPTNAFEIYKLGAKYYRLTGTFYLREINRDDVAPGTLNIYGNDNLLYTFSGMAAGVEPVQFDIDLTGVDELKIEIDSGSAYACGSFQVGDAIIYPIVP